MARRLGPILAGLSALVILGLLGGVWWRGSQVDGCAEALVVAAGAKDAATIGRYVPSPNLAARILAARQIELGFARPMSGDWSRVGLIVTSSTSAPPSVLVLILETAPLPECRFLRDYDEGAFSGATEDRPSSEAARSGSAPARP